MLPFQSLADLVKHFESSGGNYQAVNPKSGAGGAYQFVPSTWRAYAPAAGVDLNQYPVAQNAPPAAQDAVFQHAVATRGLGDYTCPGCNAPLSSYLQANPQARNLPVISGQPDTGTPTTPPAPVPAPTQAPAPAAGPNPALLAAAMNSNNQLSSLFNQPAQQLQNYYSGFMNPNNTQSA